MIEAWRKYRKANWIWYPGAQRTVNFYFFARKTFEIDSRVLKAKLHISAYTDYKLFINDKYIGRGPDPSAPKYQYYDTYNIKKYLAIGSNVIGTIAHNWAMGMHWHPMGPGGLIVQLEIDTEKGKEILVTDERWKLNKANCLSLNSPRMMRSCQFVETFDFRKYKENWLNADFDDSDWEKPEVIGKPPTQPWMHLVPREIPFLHEELKYPVCIDKGKYKVMGFHAISFDRIIPNGKNYIGYAQTYFYSNKERKLVLNISCDDAFKAFLNDKLVLEQCYDEEFVRTRVWNGREDYEQFHYGLGGRKEKAEVVLHQGWNQLLVVVDQGEGGWGFSLGFVDLRDKPFAAYLPYCSEEFEDLIFSNTKDKKSNKWILSGPFESTGFKNSLNNVQVDRIPTGKRQIEHDPFDYEKIVNYAYLMRAEERKDCRKVFTKAPLILSKGELCIADFGKVRTGYPALEIESPENGIIDVGYCNVLGGDKRILSQWQVRYVDRIYLKPGIQRWEVHSRRTCKYMHISCRRGENINIRKIGINSVGYPVKDIVNFKCSDTLLNKIYDVSKYTVKLLMQDVYGDCLRREGSIIWNRSFIHMFPFSPGFCTSGDDKLAKKTLLHPIRTQEDSGWFSGYGYTDGNVDSPTTCLWWIVALKDYYLFLGDSKFIMKIYENVKSALRHFSRFENMHGLIDGRNEVHKAGDRWAVLDDGFAAYVGRCMYKGELAGFNFLYYASLNSVAFLAEELGFTDDAKFYRRKAAWVKKSCNERFWDKRKNLFADWLEDNKLFTEGTPALLVTSLYFDIGDKSKSKKVFNYIYELGKKGFENYNFATGGYYYFLIEVLFRHGKVSMALDLMRTYYGKWLESGATTTGEHFSLKNLKGKKIILNSDYEVNGQGTSAYVHFYSNILGIKPIKPGFKEILFEPHPGDLKWAKGTVHIPQGKINVSWQVDNSTFKMEIEIPKECKYKVSLPKSYEDCQVKVNGRLE